MNPDIGIIESISTEALYDQLAEEAAELAHAALKMSRKIRGENPTPITFEEAMDNVMEEYTDVIYCSRVLNLNVSEEQIIQKRKRWIERIIEESQNKGEDKLYVPAIIIGQIGSGKTTLAKALEKTDFKQIITYTTRPIRKGEVNDVDYHFISENEFLTLVNEEFFVEYTYYGTVHGRWYYGSAKEDYLPSKEKKVIILNPDGIFALKSDAFVIWINTDIPTCITRSIIRGDNKYEVLRRINTDEEKFDKIMADNLYNFRVDKVTPLDDLVDMVREKYNRYNETKK